MSSLAARVAAWWSRPATLFERVEWWVCFVGLLAVLYIMLFVIDDSLLVRAIERLR